MRFLFDYAIKMFSSYAKVITCKLTDSTRIIEIILHFMFNLFVPFSITHLHVHIYI